METDSPGPSDLVQAPLFLFFLSFCLKLESGQHRGVGGKGTATREAIILGWDHCLAASIHASGLLRLNWAARALTLSHRHARSDIQGHFSGRFAAGRSCCAPVRLSAARVTREIYWAKVKWAAQCFRWQTSVRTCNTSLMLIGWRNAAIRLGNGLWMIIRVGQSLHLFMGDSVDR